MVRPPPCCDLKRDRDEDAKHGAGNLTAASKKEGMKRCGKSCRLRLNNFSKSDLSSEEEELIIKLHAAIGSRWTIIAQQLPGRTENEIKNQWNTKLKKKLKEMGIDPVTHKPFSQIFADYNNISTQTRENSNFTSKKNPNHNYNDSTHSHSHSLDLLSQLQAITLVSKQMALPDNGTLSENQMANVPPPESFSWHDFLLEPVQDHNGSCSLIEMRELGNNSKDVSRVESLDGTLFMEAMLDQENDMFLNFPALMEEPLY